MHVIDRDKGLKALRERMRRAPGLDLVVGIREDAADATGEDSEVRVGDYATWNEFGAGVPERSFFRSTVDEHRGDYQDELQDAAVAILDGADPVRGLELLGALVQRDVKRKIVDLDDPPNAPQTITAKGSSNPLVDTSRMLNSIDYEVRANYRDPSSGVS